MASTDFRDRAARFQAGLLETGGYRTDPSRRRDFLGRFDTWFYWKVAKVVYSGSWYSVRGKFDREEWARHSFDLLDAVEACGGRIEISGMEHPASLKGPAVYVGNHMSMVETFLLPVMLNSLNYLAAVIKDDLLRYPYFGDIMRAVDPIGVGRTNPRKDLQAVLVKGRECLKAGRSVMLFPQATRSSIFRPGKFNTLGVKLALSAGVPVVPIALKTDFQKNGSLIKDLGPLDREKTVYFKFGAPLAPDGTSKETQAAVVRFIAENLRAWGGTVEDRR